MSISLHSDNISAHYRKKERESNPSPSVNNRASTIRDYYKDHPFIVDLDSPTRHTSGPTIQIMREVEEWCKSSCEEDCQVGLHRVLPHKFKFDSRQDWIFSDTAAGQDRIFVAFKNEKDYLLFNLKW